MYHAIDMSNVFGVVDSICMMKILHDVIHHVIMNVFLWSPFVMIWLSSNRKKRWVQWDKGNGGSSISLGTICMTQGTKFFLSP